MPRHEGQSVGSPKLRELLQLWYQMTATAKTDEDRAQVRDVLERGLRQIFEVVPDTDPRLWRRCLDCQDTGYRRVTRRPPLYGGQVELTFTRPCHCERGGAMQRAIDGAAQRAKERRHPQPKSPWTRQGRLSDD